MVVRIARPTRAHAQFGTQAITTPTAQGLPEVDDLWEELQGYVDIILGREEPPIDYPAYLALAEIATAYYCRGQEIEMMIHNAEREGVVMRGSALYRFRTGELRSFIELAKRAAELGSRRLTQEQLLYQMRLEA